MNKKIKYHLRELEIARNEDSNKYCMPVISEQDKAILDIGCGIGQLFIASELKEDVVSVGIDIEIDALRYGRERYDNIYFIKGNGEALPFSDNVFDLVVSRVTLPYMDIPRTINEISRVLRTGGRIWLSLHPFSMQRKRLKHSFLSFNIKDIIYTSYIILNGIIFNLVGKVVRFPLNKRFESFQTTYSMTRLLSANSFKQIAITNNKHFIVTAIKIN